MPRAAGIWRRKADGKFYTKHQGRQIRLGDSLPDATLAFHRLHAGVATDDELSVADVLNCLPRA